MRNKVFYRNGLRYKGLLAFLFVLFFAGGVKAAGEEYKREKISVQTVNEAVGEVLNKIGKIANVRFFYNHSDMNFSKKISINAVNRELKDIISEVLEGYPVEVEYQLNRTVVIRKAIAQNLKVQKIGGLVKDAKTGEPLIGASIVLKEQKGVGVVTDAEGKFHIEFLENSATALLISYVGYETKEFALLSSKNMDSLDILLYPMSIEMESAVITGIYSRKKESFTGSAQTYTNKELKMTGNINLLQSLKTLDPSFAIMENDLYGSDPNRMPEININGQSSIKALHSEYDKDPNAPLFILDGFETTLEVINDLSMDRVQSITLLKDAASTAIYGAKAANGVIVVETKAPEAGQLRVNYNGTYQVAWADLSDYNLMNASEKLEFEKLSGHYGIYDEEGYFDEDYNGEKYYSRLAEVERGVNTYWMSEPLRVAFTHGHNLFVEGGDNVFRYSLGVSYRRTAGVMKGSDRDAMNGNIRLIYRYKNLSFTNYTNVDLGNAISENANFSDFSRANPYYRKRNELGQITKVLEAFETTKQDEFEYEYNPLYDMKQKHRGEDKTCSVRNNFNIEWKIIPALQLRGRFSVTKSMGKGIKFDSPNLSRFADMELTERGSYSETRSDALTYEGDVTLTFGKMFAEKHLLNAVVGMDFRSSSNQNSGYAVKGFLTDRFDNPAFSNGFPDGAKPNYAETETRSASYYFNGGYTYDNRYLLDFNFRIDGASVFGVNNLFTGTWAVGAGWNLHNESFLRGNCLVNYLKLRFSIGNPGNQNLEAKMANNAYTYVTAYPNVFGLAALVDSWGNKNLDWQKTINTNYGVDLEILNRRIKMTLEYYYKKTDPQIVSIDLPPSTGSGTMPENLGGLKSYGLTMSLNIYLMNRENLRWSINANLRHSNSKYYNIGDALSKYKNPKGNVSNTLMRFYDGANTTDLYAVRSAGIDPATGREIFIKQDGTPTYIYDVNDQVKVGNSTPKIEGIVGTSLYYKGFSCSVNFRYKNGGQAFMNTLYEKVENISEKDLRKNQDKRALYDRWKKPGDKAKFKSISLTENTPISSRFVEDENIFSCESITLNYETQAKWLSYAGISSLTVSASTNEIFRISTIKNERGLEYPFQRSVNFSLGIRF